MYRYDGEYGQKLFNSGRSTSCDSSVYWPQLTKDNRKDIDINVLYQKQPFLITS